MGQAENYFVYCKWIYCSRWNFWIVENLICIAAISAAFWLNFAHSASIPSVHVMLTLQTIDIMWEYWPFCLCHNLEGVLSLNLPLEFTKDASILGFHSQKKIIIFRLVQSIFNFGASCLKPGQLTDLRIELDLQIYWSKIKRGFFCKWYPKISIGTFQG